MSVSSTSLDSRSTTWQSRALDASVGNVSLKFSGILDQLSLPDLPAGEQASQQYSDSFTTEDEESSQENDTKSKGKSGKDSSESSSQLNDASNPLAALMVQQPVQPVQPVEQSPVDSSSETADGASSVQPATAKDAAPTAAPLFVEVKPQEASAEIQQKLQQVATASQTQGQQVQVQTSGDAQVAATLPPSQSLPAKTQDSSVPTETTASQNLQGTSATAQVKIDSLSYNNSQQQGGQQEQTGFGQQDVLKHLLNKQSNYAAVAGRGQDSAAAAQAVASASTTSSGPASSSASSAVETSLTEKVSGLKESFSSSLGKGLSEGALSGQNALFSGDVKNSGLTAQSSVKSSAQTALSSSLGSVSSLQELVDKLPSALRGSNLDSKDSLSMDVTVDGLGQVKVNIEREGDKISVNVQTDDRSSRDQLSDQKESLEREMRKLGYKDVSVDIGSGGSGDSSSNAWRKSGSALGNAASEENVKLSRGDDSSDLAEILAMKS